jgi:hypothetical protein
MNKLKAIANQQTMRADLLEQSLSEKTREIETLKQQLRTQLSQVSTSMQAQLEALNTTDSRSA